MFFLLTSKVFLIELHNALKFEHANFSFVLCVSNVRRGLVLLAAHLILKSNTTKACNGLILLLSLLVFPVFSWAGNLPDHVPAQVLYVIDGDTFRAQVHIWPDLTIESNIRVARIDTPEKKRGSECEAERQAGYAASAYAKQLLAKKSQVILSGLRKGKYAGRMIAEVQLADGRNFSDIMLKSGHAIAYDGGKKHKVWCK